MKFVCFIQKMTQLNCTPYNTVIFYVKIYLQIMLVSKPTFEGGGLHSLNKILKSV